MTTFKERALGIDSSKKRVNSKVKGNRNEVEVAKALSKWTGYTFRRTPASGAIHVPLDWLCGDVFCTSRELDFRWSVETKHYKKITIGLIAKWWEQTCKDAARAHKMPMLIYRENGWPKGEWRIQLDYGLKFMRPDVYKRMWPLIPTAYNISSKELFNIDYNEFVKHIDL